MCLALLLVAAIVVACCCSVFPEGDVIIMLYRGVSHGLHKVISLADLLLVYLLQAFWGLDDAIFSLGDAAASATEGRPVPPVVPPVVSFGPAGILGVYYIGVAEYMKEHFECDDVHACGVSGGFFGAASMALRLSHDQHWRAACNFDKCVKRRSCYSFFLSASEFIHGGYLPVMQPEEKLFLEHAHKFHMGVTRFVPWPQSMVVGEYTSLKELIYVGTCSMRTPPFYRNPGKLNGRYVLDGALTRSFVVPTWYRFPRKGVLTVSVFPRGAAICPQQSLGGLSDVISSRTLCDRWRFDDLFRRGYHDALRSHEVIRSYGFKERKLN